MLISFHTTANNRSRLPLNLRLIGIDHTQEIVKRPRGLSMEQLFYCIEGKGELIIEDQKYHIVKGDAFLIRANQRHQYHSLTDKWVLNFIGFEGNICNSLLNTIKMAESGVYQLSNPAIFNEHLNKLYEISTTTGSSKQIRYSSTIYTMLLHMASVLTKLEGTTISADNEIAEEILNYLEEHYSESIGLSDIAKHLERTSEYLCSVFKEATGITIIKALTNIRINHARSYLIHYPDKKVAVIGQMCGFQDPSYFGKIFKTYTKLSPNEYRAQYL